jgi:cell division protein FtsL
MFILFYLGMAIAVTILGILYTAKKVAQVMASLSDLQNDIQAVVDAIANLAREIADLKNSGGPVSQAQLDALDVSVQAALAAAQAAV